MTLLSDNPTAFDYFHAIRAVASQTGQKMIFDLADAGMNLDDPMAKGRDEEKPAETLQIQGGENKIILARNQIGEYPLRMSNTNQLTAREIELKLQFVRMTRQEIETMMNTTDNTTTRLICWEYLQTF